MNEWILCKERLPNEDEIPYDGIGRKDKREISDRVLACDAEGRIEVGYFITSGKSHNFTNKRYEFGDHYKHSKESWIVPMQFEPIAWMSLPKSYIDTEINR